MKKTAAGAFIYILVPNRVGCVGVTVATEKLKTCFLSSAGPGIELLDDLDYWPYLIAFSLRLLRT